MRPKMGAPLLTILCFHLVQLLYRSMVSLMQFHQHVDWAGVIHFFWKRTGERHSTPVSRFRKLTGVIPSKLPLGQLHIGLLYGVFADCLNFMHANSTWEIWNRNYFFWFSGNTRGWWLRGGSPSAVGFHRKSTATPTSETHCYINIAPTTLEMCKVFILLC